LIRHIFVYGTLRLGHGANAAMRGAQHKCVATLSGARLYHLGGFPGLRFSDDSSDVVVGDLYEVLDDSIYRRLDQYEGYRESQPETSLYLRQVTTVTTPEQEQVQAYVYVYNHDGGRLIPSGDWNDQKV